MDEGRSLMMRKHTLSFLLVAAIASAVLVPACSSSDETVNDDLEDSEGLFGDDRVADALRHDMSKVPANFADAEKLFKIGRACARSDSKEVFVVEETQTRGVSGLSRTPTLLPRAVVAGCNTPDVVPPPGVTDPQWGSYSLFAALFSDPSTPAGQRGDTMVFDRVEMMALDRKTGLYNFYVFGPGPSRQGPGFMQRIRLTRDNKVVVVERTPESTRSTKTISKDSRLCNDCHVNMGPLMNEMSEPWTNWVSTRKTLPAVSSLSGATRDIVSEAIAPGQTHSRTSFANDLEKIMLSAIAAYNDGLPRADGTVQPGTGYVQANIDGTQPKNLAGLLKSVFCETELKFASSIETIPLELFVDPFVFGSALQRPPANATEPFPIMMPVRSEMDKRIERSLIKRNVISFKTATAVRLIDENNDVFSSARCGLYPKVLAALPKEVAKIDSHVRGIISASLAGLVPAGSRRTYIKLLIDESASTTDISNARAAYVAEASARVVGDFAKIQTPAGIAELKKRSTDRKSSATRMFPGDRSPLPLLTPED